MTNNNWIKEFDSKFKHDWKPTELKQFISNLLTKKDPEAYERGYKDYINHPDRALDRIAFLAGKAEARHELNQEHKAELEMIKGEIKSEKIGEDGEYNEALRDAISILDIHINKPVDNKLNELYG